MTYRAKRPRGAYIGARLRARNFTARRVHAIADIVKAVLARAIPPETVLAGETLCKTYVHEAARCRCPADGVWWYIPTTSIARGPGYDRCVRCNTVWQRKTHVWSKGPIIVRGRGRKALIGVAS